jgi:hypothetical protein
MKKNTIFFLVFLPSFLFSQQWHAYSDSIISNINKKNYEKATRFVELADSDISNLKPEKDTIYADFIYRKGVLNYFQSKKCLNYLKESLSIWDDSDKKNYFKIMKIYYFLAGEYSKLGDHEKGYDYYEKCYLMNKSKKLPFNNNFSSSIYNLAFIDYNTNLNFKKAKQYAQEYIDYNKDKAISEFNFFYAYAYTFIEDRLGFESVMLEFEKYYIDHKLNDFKLHYNIIYSLLVSYNIRSNYKGVIKYGEKCIKLYDSNVVGRQYLNDLYEMLENAYKEEGDKINAYKYEKLLKI